MLALAATAAAADIRYVSDELVIPLRAEKYDGAEVIDYIRTGTPLEVLEENPPYLKVRMQSGKEGWVLHRYITNETPKSKVIDKLKREIAAMKASSGDPAKLTADIDALRAENKRLKTESERLRRESENTERMEAIYWFLAGGGVFFLGWLIGKASGRKRYY